MAIIEKTLTGSIGPIASNASLTTNINLGLAASEVAVILHFGIFTPLGSTPQYDVSLPLSNTFTFKQNVSIARYYLINTQAPIHVPQGQANALALTITNKMAIPVTLSYVLSYAAIPSSMATNYQFASSPGTSNTGILLGPPDIGVNIIQSVYVNSFSGTSNPSLTIGGNVIAADPSFTNGQVTAKNTTAIVSRTSPIYQVNGTGNINYQDSLSVAKQYYVSYINDPAYI